MSIVKFAQLTPLWRQLCNACVIRESLPLINRSWDKRFFHKFQNSFLRKCFSSGTEVAKLCCTTRQLHEGNVVSPNNDQPDVNETEDVPTEEGRRHRRRPSQRGTGSSDRSRQVAQLRNDDWDDSLAERPVAAEEIRSHFPHSFNLAAYVDKSESLQKLVQLGVDLSLLEQKKDVATWLVKRDFERDLAPHIKFLHENGVVVDEIGRFINKNPRIFTVPIEDLQVRINYLESKKFDRESITRILIKAPQFIQSSTTLIDDRLGVFQKKFHLSGDEVRHLTTRMPKIILCNLKALSVMTFALKEQLGFSIEEIKQLLLHKPKIFVLSLPSLTERFEFLHNELGFTHAAILDFPGCLVQRKFRMKQRHLFLVELKRAQYDPKQPLYVSLRNLTTGSDSDFCNDVAKTSVSKFNDFLMTL